MKPYCLVLTCDRNYLNPALVVAAQFAKLSLPGLDLLICSGEEVDGLNRDFVSFRRIEVPDFIKLLPVNDRLREYAYWRIPAIEVLTQEYSRVLYLDTDIFLNSPSVGELFGLEMHGYTLAAALDVHQIVNPQRKISEFAELNLEHAGYFNSGVLLIDSMAWQEKKAFNQMKTLCAKHGHVFSRHDQSLLNLAFKNDWLEISPVWNWQYSYRNSFLTEWVSPRLIHFSGARKPWNSPGDSIPRRYSETYNSILKALGEEMAIDLPHSPKLRSKLSTMAKNLWYYRAHCAHIERFAHDLSTIGHGPGETLSR